MNKHQYNIIRINNLKERECLKMCHTFEVWHIWRQQVPGKDVPHFWKCGKSENDRMHLSFPHCYQPHALAWGKKDEIPHFVWDDGLVDEL